MSKTQQRERWNRTGPEIAAIFGVSAEAVSNWVKNGAPKIGHNQYDERLFVPWVIELYKSRDKATLAEEQTRLTRHKADLAEMESAEKRGELVKRQEVMDKWERVATVLRARFLALPSITQDIVSAPNLPESTKVLTDAVWNILAELSGGGPLPHAVSDTTATPHRERVGRPKPRALGRVKRRARKVEHVKG